jgi:hypothetical protein
MSAIAILGSGMVSGVGLNAPAACAAMRAAISGFTETRFKNSSGDWIIGCPAPLDQSWRGLDRLANLACRQFRNVSGLLAASNRRPFRFFFALRRKNARADWMV